jgi:Protein of unknown function (DUF4232)
MRLAVLTFGLALVIAGCAGPPTIPPSGGPASGGPSTAPSEAPSAAPSAKSVAHPSPSPTAKPIAACLASQLAAKVTSWVGAAGSQIASVTVTNTSDHLCNLQGTPEIELLDAHGNILIDSQTGGSDGLPHVAKGAPAFHLAHNGFVKTLVKDDDYCGATPALPTTVAFVLPSNGGRLVAAKGPGGTVPQCASDPGTPGAISMNGWAK